LNGPTQAELKQLQGLVASGARHQKI
jgi:hypothetical protein